MGFRRKLKKQFFSGFFFKVGFQIDWIAGKKIHNPHTIKLNPFSLAHVLFVLQRILLFQSFYKRIFYFEI